MIFLAYFSVLNQSHLHDRSTVLTSIFKQLIILREKYNGRLCYFHNSSLPYCLRVGLSLVVRFFITISHMDSQEELKNTEVLVIQKSSCVRAYL